MLALAALATSLKIAIGAAAGGIVGAAYFASLFANARCYSRHAIGTAIALQAARFGVLALALFGLARLGPAALLAALASIVLARHVAIRLTRQAP
ncbi:MAG TPA: ATP synthase subunit I [Trinickia sp.]|uniref:N-ATPase subunit AtpR n=1 Tax=Trinickia sp. TaxID=2571163 RepID=UPI002C692FA0|nr:ATP synthase subunit I [Trinickia sp.]HVW48821.1 ATP synthase subunit I [Trinickia sp.]